jgi:inner membrane protein
MSNDTRRSWGRIGTALAAGSLHVINCVRAHPLSMVAAIGAIDLILQRGVTFWATAGPLDGVAHLLTTALLLALMTRQRNPVFRTAALVASVLIDLDHIPIYAGWHPLIAHAPRPYTHSLTTVVVAGILACLMSRRARCILAGIAVGVLFHLVRDVATAGVPLFWPVSTVNVQVPYALYAAVMVGSAVALRVSQRVGPEWSGQVPQRIASMETQ